MKTIVVLIAMSIFSASAIAQFSSASANSWKNKYCATMKDGKLTVMNEGKAMTADVTLANGVKIKTDGTVTKANGTMVTLKDGECVDNAGNVVAKEKMKKAEKMPAK